MIYRLIFNRASLDKKRSMLSNKGVNIGCFKRNDRQAFIYLLDDFFVEVIYVNDDVKNSIEVAQSFTDYRKLEKYMEESIKDGLK